MANFLGNLGAAFQGQQNYQTFLAQQNQAKQDAQIRAAQIAQLQQQQAQAQAQAQRQPIVDQATLDYLAQSGQPQGIPPPPQPAPTPQVANPPPSQPPAPGQASVPMTQAGQPDPRLMGPRKPTVPPYQSVSGGPQPQAQPTGIPAPPTIAPQPGSMTLADAAKFIKKQGITDPIASMQILEKLTPYLNNEAKQEAAMLKMQVASQEKQIALQEKAREADLRSQDTRYSADQREQAAREANQIRLQLGSMMAGIAKMNAETNREKADTAAGKGVGGGTDQDKAGVDAAAWNYLLRGANPPARGGVYQAVMKRVGEIAKENNMSVQELTSASADVKTKLAAKKNFEVRAQNLSRAENQLNAEIPNMEDAMKKLSLSNLPAAAKANLWVARQMGDPNVTALDQAAHTVFNEFEGIITGNPGALNVQDVQNARTEYENAQTPEQMKAAIAGMRRITKNAKTSLDTTRRETMEDINAEFKKPQAGPVIGTVQDGYKFKGGDPSQQSNWEKQ